MEYNLEKTREEHGQSIANCNAIPGDYFCTLFVQRFRIKNIFCGFLSNCNTDKGIYFRKL